MSGAPINSEKQAASPAIPIDAVEVIKHIVDQGAMANDDFFTHDSLAGRFGRQVKIDISTVSGPTQKAEIVGFRDLADATPHPAVANGMSIVFLKYPNSDGSLVCYVNAQFRGFSSGLDFDSVVARLGPAWRRDTQAENRKFFAVTEEPFNPPLPKVTAKMGSAIIVYGEGYRAVNLEFSPNGNLFSVTRWRLPC